MTFTNYWFEFLDRLFDRQLRVLKRVFNKHFFELALSIGILNPSAMKGKKDGKDDIS